MDAIVNEMVISISSQNPKEEIWLPHFVYAVPFMRLLPTRCYDWIHKVTRTHLPIHDVLYWLMYVCIQQ